MEDRECECEGEGRKAMEDRECEGEGEKEGKSVLKRRREKEEECKPLKPQTDESDRARHVQRTAITREEPHQLQRRCHLTPTLNAGT